MREVLSYRVDAYNINHRQPRIMIQPNDRVREIGAPDRIMHALLVKSWHEGTFALCAWIANRKLVSDWFNVRLLEKVQERMEENGKEGEHMP